MIRLNIQFRTHNVIHTIFNKLRQKKKSVFLQCLEQDLNEEKCTDDCIQMQHNLLMRAGRQWEGDVGWIADSHWSTL